jgi:Protein of unknown function (DUF3047)
MSFRPLRIAFLVIPVLLAAGCAGTSESAEPQSAEQDDGLLASTAVVIRMAPADGDLVEVGRFSRLSPSGPVAQAWEPYTLQPSNPLTEYRPVKLDGQVCIEADATNGHSALQRLIRISPQRHPIIEWSWRVPWLASDYDPRIKRPSPRARLMLAFHGDADKLDIEQRVQLRLAKAVTGRSMPYSSLIYVWLNGVPAGTVVPSPYSDRVRLIAMDASESQLDRWVDLRRDVVEDYRRAFGEEPGDIVGVGIFTDVDSNGAPGRAYYGDISFRSQR